MLRPGGQLHVADWGRATGRVMRVALVPVQLLDGLANTRDNIRGKLPTLFDEAVFSGVTQTRTFSTFFGTLAFYRAVKPVGAAPTGNRAANDTESR